MAQQRKIIHVDMDAFFASVEQRDFPEYQNKPLIVGGSPQSRGVVAACSYEARKFGIHSAMPCAQAYRLCPQAIFMPPRFEVYKELSVKIREIFWRYATQVEPLSLDEAYLDVSYTSSFDGSATKIAQAIKREILAETGLVASAGVSYNKFLAKIASDMDKPDGLYVIKPEQGAAFVEHLSIAKFYGVGPVTAKKMAGLGIHTGFDIKVLSMDELKGKLGNAADYYYNIVRGIDERPVRSSRVRKSLGKETTFGQDIVDTEQLLAHLYVLADKVYVQLEKGKLKPKTITIKVKYNDFTQVTRSHTMSQPLESLVALKSIIPQLLAQSKAGKVPVRLVGVSTSGFGNHVERAKHIDVQLNLKGL